MPVVNRTNEALLSHQEIRRLFDYDPETGVLRWRVDRGVNKTKGREIKSGGSHGYLDVKINGKKYMAHRVVWFYTYGEWPADELDHANKDRKDNRIKNLRPATHSENQHNSTKYKNNTSGYTGVSFHKRKGKWMAYIGFCGKRKTLGYFDTPQLAHEAYCEKAKELFGEFARPS